MVHAVDIHVVHAVDTCGGYNIASVDTCAYLTGCFGLEIQNNTVTTLGLGAIVRIIVRIAERASRASGLADNY